MIKSMSYIGDCVQQQHSNVMSGYIVSRKNTGNSTSVHITRFSFGVTYCLIIQVFQSFPCSPVLVQYHHPKNKKEVPTQSKHAV